MTATEYFEKEFPATDDLSVEFMSGDMISFAESYLKAKVESITDDEIHEKSFDLEEHIDHRTGYRKCAKWLKSELLK